MKNTLVKRLINELNTIENNINNIDIVVIKKTLTDEDEINKKIEAMNKTIIEKEVSVRDIKKNDDMCKKKKN